MGLDWLSWMSILKSELLKKIVAKRFVKETKSEIPQRI